MCQKKNFFGLELPKWYIPKRRKGAARRMIYQNGKPYLFKFGNGCTVKATLENFTPATVEKFNKELARQLVGQYKRKQKNLEIS